MKDTKLKDKQNKHKHEVGTLVDFNFAGVVDCPRCKKPLYGVYPAIYTGLTWWRDYYGYTYKLTKGFDHTCGQHIDFYLDPINK